MAFTETKNKFIAIILALTMFLGLATPMNVEAGSGGVGGIDDLDPSFSENGFGVSENSDFGNENDSESVWNDIIGRFHTQIAGVFGIFFLIALYKFGELALKLIFNADNPRNRGATIIGFIVAGVGAGLLGALTTIFGFFYHILISS